jgi:hypothetical protein
LRKKKINRWARHDDVEDEKERKRIKGYPENGEKKKDEARE